VGGRKEQGSLSRSLKSIGALYWQNWTHYIECRTNLCQKEKCAMNRKEGARGIIIVDWRHKEDSKGKARQPEYPSPSKEETVVLKREKRS